MCECGKRSDMVKLDFRGSFFFCKAKRSSIKENGSPRFYFPTGKTVGPSCYRHPQEILPALPLSRDCIEFCEVKHANYIDISCR